MRILIKVRGYAILMRPHNLAATVITTLVGWLAVAVKISNGNILNPIYPVLTVLFVAAGGYVINDYFDYEVDKVNKAYRPIPSGIVGRKEALTFSLALGAAGIAFSCLSGPYTITFALLNALLTYLYSYRIKEWGFAGNVTVAFEGAASIVYGALATAEYVGHIYLVSASLIPALYAFLLLLAREIVKTIEDYKADEVRGVKSIPRLYGIRAASFLSAFLLALVLAISPLPYFLGYGYSYLTLAGLTDAIIVYSCMILLRLPKNEEPEWTAARLRSILKAAIFTGSLAFFTDLLLTYLKLFTG